MPNNLKVGTRRRTVSRCSTGGYRCTVNAQWWKVQVWLKKKKKGGMKWQISEYAWCLQLRLFLSEWSHFAWILPALSLSLSFWVLILINPCFLLVQQAHPWSPTSSNLSYSRSFRLGRSMCTSRPGTGCTLHTWGRLRATPGPGTLSGCTGRVSDFHSLHTWRFPTSLRETGRDAFM